MTESMTPDDLRALRKMQRRFPSMAEKIANVADEMLVGTTPRAHVTRTTYTRTLGGYLAFVTSYCPAFLDPARQTFAVVTGDDEVTAIERGGPKIGTKYATKEQAQQVARPACADMHRELDEFVEQSAAIAEQSRR
jgi:hypothetical protein